MMIAAIMVILPANAGVSPDTGRAIGDNGTAIIGETNLKFVDKDGNVIPHGAMESTWRNSNINIPFTTPFDTTSSKVKDKLVEGKYRVVGNGKTIYVYFVSPSLSLKTKVNGEDFGWIQRGKEITIEATTNLNLINLNLTKGSLPNKINLKLENPDGIQLDRVNGVSLSGICVDSNGNVSLNIDTSGLDTGEYHIHIEPDPDTNNGLDVPGKTVSFEVRESGVARIEAKPTARGVSEPIELRVHTMPHTNITLEVTHGIERDVMFTELTEGSLFENGVHRISGESSDTGTFTVKALFNDTGTYEITATEPFAGTKATVTVKIKPPLARLTEPKEGIYVIGEKLAIKGMTYGGKRVTIKAGDKVYREVPLSKITGNARYNKEFSCSEKWDTSGLTPGKYRVDVWVLPSSDPAKDPPDDSVIIVLVQEGLTVELDHDFVAKGDTFRISGKAEGRDRVDILIIAPRGGNGHGLDPFSIFDETGGKLDAPGLTYITREVTGGTFETDDIMVPQDADTGTYLVVVLNYGHDHVWGTNTGTSDLIKVLTYDYATDPRIKTQDQILDTLKDRTVDQAGSDDLMVIKKIIVEKPFLKLNDIKDVAPGSELKVKGVTNRNNDKTIVITVEGPVNLRPQIVRVKENANMLYNEFEATFKTEGAKVGSYTVVAEDDAGHQDSKTFRITPAAAAATVTPAPHVSSTPAATAINRNATAGRITNSGNKSVAVNTSSALYQQPGFGTVVGIAAAIVAIVLIAVLINASGKKKQQPPYKRKVLHTLPPPPSSRRKRWLLR